jgi:hypothetical protein
MVDSIRSTQNAGTNVSATRLNSSTATEISSTLPAEKDPLTPSKTILPHTENANSVVTSPAVTLLVSKESQEKATQDLAIAKLVRKANAVKEPYNQEKVAYFKKLAQDPKALADYLQNVDTNAIAETLLTNAEGSLFS